jgi:autotransporter-associated beta strand protein
LDQTGTGLLKLAGPLVLSGYGESKTIVLTGSNAGVGELACNIEDPYDRKGKATTAVTKSGTGTWALSGSNDYTGPTTVAKGTLSLASTRSLGARTDVFVSEGATIELNFEGEMHIHQLYLDGKLQPAGSYSAASAVKYIRGTGVLRNR